MSSALFLARTFACAAITALLTLLALAPSAFAATDGTVKYEYVPTALVYDATGFVDGSKFGSTSCNPNVDAIWSGEVDAYSYVSEPTEGDGSFKITEHGETGKFVAHRLGFATFSASHSLVTGCDDSMPPSANTYENTPCSSPDPAPDIPLLIVGTLTGGVGTSVNVKWRISTDPLSSANYLLPDSFSCVEPFAFPAAKCDPIKTTINKLAGKNVKLPFGCLGKTSVPPAGSGYRDYGSSDAASGTLSMKRTKIH
jgi:hypothetical protein